MSSICFVHMLQSINSQGYRPIQIHRCEKIFKEHLHYTPSHQTYNEQ